MRSSNSDDKKRILSALIWAVIAVSVAIRIYKLDNPILEYHGFRQSQTAISVWAFEDGDHDLLAYETPIFGPPWQIPMEFPTFQYAAYWVNRISPIGLDASCRLTNIAFFYLSAWMMYLLACKAFSRKTARCSLIVYVLMPFCVVWSRTSMIDYASLFFGLAYAWCGWEWLTRHSRMFFGMALITGTAAYLTKVTTIAACGLFFGIPILAGLWVVWREKKTDAWRWLVPAAVLLLVPFLVGVLWVYHADQIKSRSPYSEFLVSKALQSWNFGSLRDRVDLTNWLVILARLWLYALPKATILVAVAGICFACRNSLQERVAVLTVLASALAPILIFFNLYVVHDYYLMAITPHLAVLCGLGISWLGTIGTRKLAVIGPVFLAVILMSHRDAIAYTKMAYRDLDDALACRLGDEIREMTLPDDRILIADLPWDSSVLYYARRRGFMLDDMHVIYESYPHATKPTYHDVPVIDVEFLKDHRFTVVVARRDHSQLLRQWRSARALRVVGEFTIFLVSDDPESALTSN